MAYFVILLLLYVHATTSQYVDPDFGPFCEIGNNGGKLCCTGRMDNCSLPRGSGLMETRCYCDSFCIDTNPRRMLADCCPDYDEVCLGIKPAPTKTPPTTTSAPENLTECYYNGRYYLPNTQFKSNCQTCQCTYVNNVMRVTCSMDKCLIDTDLIDVLNRQRLPWTAGNVTNFWGRKRDEGYKMLGTNYSSKRVRTMYPVRNGGQKSRLPRSFDWRSSGYVAPIVDQNFCNASWSYSIVSTFSDRLAKWSKGSVTGPLSYQQHRSCVGGIKRQAAGTCTSGYLTRYWRYLSYKGLVLQTCYPDSPNTNCEMPEGRLASKRQTNCPSGGTGKLYRASTLIRIGDKRDPQAGEANIMKEIIDAGPVVATVRVFPEMFMYQTGIYTCPSHSISRTGYLHSVKIIGWGEDEIYGQRVPYWIAANSWGTDWGEDGFFRIRRGTNECDIEEFVLSFLVDSKRRNRRSSRRLFFETKSQV